MSIDTVEQFAKNMTVNGIHPTQDVIRETYHKGIKFLRPAMDPFPKRFQRKSGLEKWDGSIAPISLE